MSDTVIKVENLSKQYRLGTVGTGTLSHDINRLWAQLRGKEDPYLKISETNNRRIKSNSEYVWALKDINFEVKKGELLGIVGMNGAGKSTLLKILSQITRPTTGSVKMKGRVGSLLEVGTGFHPDLTGRENIYINGAILGMRRKEINEKLDEIIEFAGVERYIDTPVKRYSSGMMVRLGFSVAAHLEPEILIVDEVLAVGDIEFQKKCIGKMSEVSGKEGKTILFVSHNLGAIEKLCNRGLLISQGSVISQSSDIGSITKQYMNLFKTTKANSSLELFQSEFFTPKLFFIGDSSGKELLGQVSGDSDFYVYIKGVSEKTDAGLHLGFSVLDESHNLVFLSYNMDSDEEHWQKLGKGINFLRVKLPRNLFKSGNYTIELGLAIHHKQWIFEPGVNAPIINFEIEGGVQKSIFWSSSRPGVVGPVIVWEKV